MSLPEMPEYKEGHITLWRDGKWVSIPVSLMPQIYADDNANNQTSLENNVTNIQPIDSGNTDTAN